MFTSRMKQETDGQSVDGAAVPVHRDAERSADIGNCLLPADLIWCEWWPNETRWQIQAAKKTISGSSLSTGGGTRSSRRGSGQHLLPPGRLPVDEFRSCSTRPHIDDFWGGPRTHRRYYISLMDLGTSRCPLGRASAGDWGEGRKRMDLWNF